MTTKNNIFLYNTICDIEHNSIYFPDVVKNIELAEIISNGYEKMTDEEMRSIVSKCMTMKHIKHILLKHELHNKKYEIRDMNIDEFRFIIKKLLHRYQSKAGGFKFHHRIWRIVPNDGHINFENDIHVNNIHDYETVEYMRGLLTLFNNISKNIEVRLLTKLNDRDKNVLVILQCSYK